MSRPRESSRPGNIAFWKIAGAGATFQAGSSAVDSATIVASLVYQLTGNVFAVGAASAVLRLGWLLPQVVVGFLAQRADRRMPFYVVGAFGRAICLALIAALLAAAAGLPRSWRSLSCWPPAPAIGGRAFPVPSCSPSATPAGRSNSWGRGAT